MLRGFNGGCKDQQARLLLEESMTLKRLTRLSCVPAKPSWIRSGCAAVFLSPAKPGLGHLVDWRTTNRAQGPSGKSSILLFKPAATASRYP